MEVSPRKGLSELSPRKTPRSIGTPATPPQWKRPNEVMKFHCRRRASLKSRMIDPGPLKPSTLKVASATETSKRKNPFRISLADENQKKPKSADTEHANLHLFHLLGLADPQAIHKDSDDIESIIKKIKAQHTPKVQCLDEGFAALPVDWSLRLKLRFMSTKPFPWSDTLRSCEEASGLTGFVRCIGNKESEPTRLDSSENAQFHECCLFWQFPHFPWLNMYPRHITKKRPDSEKQLPSFGSHVDIKAALHTDFTDAFRSVYQLLRVRLCPFFYLACNSFCCLFRAAGISGNKEMSALVTPSTQGFRQMLRNNDIEFEMPLRNKDKKRMSSEGLEKDRAAEDDVDDGEDHGETKEWLASLGVADHEIKNISSSLLEEDLPNSESETESSEESTIYVSGSEVCALFNVLINHRSLTASTGPLAGVPPTILSPVAFSRSTLVNLKARESIVQVENESVYSIEISGPIMPHTIQNLCYILKDSVHEYSLSCATDQLSKSFSKATTAKSKEVTTDEEKSSTNTVFGIENLSDCGLKKEIVSQFCLPTIGLYDSIKYSEKLFSIS